MRCWARDSLDSAARFPKEQQSNGVHGASTCQERNDYLLVIMVKSLIQYLIEPGDAHRLKFQRLSITNYVYSIS